MNRFRVFLKNFTAGRKALAKRMGIYLGTALAAFEVVNIFLEDGAMAEFCANTSLFGVSLKSMLTNVLLYLGVGALLAVIRQSAFAHYTARIAGTDVTLEISMADIFSNNGELVVPCNTTFAGRSDVIGDKSIQSQMTARLRQPKDSKLSNDEYFEQTVREALGTPACQSRKLPQQRELAGRLYDEYSYGTMANVTLPLDGKSRNVILLAVAQMQEAHKPRTDGIRLMQSIDDMWEQIAQDRTREQTLVVPVMGTGSAGITDKPQQTVARYILRTFADNASRLGIRRLILSVYPQDYLDNKIDLEELRAYADYLCRFPDSDFDIR